MLHSIYLSIYFNYARIFIIFLASNIEDYNGSIKIIKRKKFFLFFSSSFIRCIYKQTHATKIALRIFFLSVYILCIYIYINELIVLRLRDVSIKV